MNEGVATRERVREKGRKKDIKLKLREVNNNGKRDKIRE